MAVRERVNRSGGVGYRVVLARSLTGSKEAYFQCRDLDEAQAIARARGCEFRSNQSTAWLLRDDRKVHASAAVTILSEAKIDLPLDTVARDSSSVDTVWRPHLLSLGERAKQLASFLAIAAGVGKPLVELVEFAAARMFPSGGNSTLAELATQLIAIKNT